MLILFVMEENNVVSCNLLFIVVCANLDSNEQMKSEVRKSELVFLKNRRSIILCYSTIIYHILEEKAFNYEK